MGVKKHGGKRPNSGRKYKYGEPTKVMRIPVSLVDVVNRLMENYEHDHKLKLWLAEYQKTGKI